MWNPSRVFVKMSDKVKYNIFEDRGIHDMDDLDDAMKGLVITDGISGGELAYLICQAKMSKVAGWQLLYYEQ